MNRDTVDGDELHRHRRLRRVIDELQIPAHAAGAGSDAPDLAIRLRHRNGGKLLPVDGHVPLSARVVVAAVRAVVRARARAVAHLPGVGELRAEVWIFLIQDFAIDDRLRTAVKADCAGGKNLDFLEHQMPDVRVRPRCIRRIAAHIVADAADGHEPGHSFDQLVERNAVQVRVKPEQAGGMVYRNGDPVIDRIHHDRPVLVGRLRHRDAVGRIEDRHVDKVAEGRIAARRGPRRREQPMCMQVARIEEEIGLARIGLVP